MVNTEYNNVTHEPNEQYIGYIADLVQKLSQVMTFNYVIKPVADGSFGYARNDGSWDGVIGEIVNGVNKIIEYSCKGLWTYEY